MKEAGGPAEDKENWRAFSPDGPAFSSSSSGLSLSAAGGLGSAVLGDIGTSSSLTGSVFVTDEGGETGWVSIGLWGLEFGTVFSVVEGFGCDGAGSG